MNDARNDLGNELLFMLQTKGMETEEIKNSIYVILGKYEVQNRITDVAVRCEDENMNLLKKFIIAKSVKGCTERTIEFYGKEIKTTLLEINKPVQEITANDIRYYLAVYEQRNHVSKTTLDNRLRCLKSFFTWLSMEGMITGNEAMKVDKIKKQKIQKEAFSEMEVEKLRAACKNNKERAIIEILLSTGCRVSELVTMTKIDMDGEKINVHGKGKKDRWVYLNAKAVLALERYMEERKDKSIYLFPRLKGGKCIRYAVKKGSVPYYAVPENVEEGHMDKSSVEEMTRNLAKRAGVEKANPHKFRRTCATMALRRGMPIEQVSKMLGHEEISTTQIYLDLNEEELELAHKKYVI